MLAVSQSTDGGATWTPPAPVSNNTPANHSPVYASNGLAATHGLDGTLYSIWGSAGSAYHVGTNPSDPDTTLPGGASVDPGLGVDAASGQVIAAWNMLDEDGMAVMPLNPAGPHTVIPGSGAAQLQTPVSVVGRIGEPGVYVGYSAGTNAFLAKPAVFRFGATKGTILSPTEGARQTALAAHRERPPVGLLAPRREDLRAAQQRSRDQVGLDAVDQAALGHDHHLGPHRRRAARAARHRGADRQGRGHRRLAPAPAAQAHARTKVSGGKVTVTVLDVGDPVAGATVTVKGGGKKKTNSAGKATFKPGKGKHKASASTPYGGKGSKTVKLK